MAKITTGQRFGKWTLIEQVQVKGRDNRTRLKWECICLCGKKGIIDGYDLKKGKSTQCMHCFGKAPKNLKGKIFKDWTVIEKAPRRWNKSYWICRCKCGIKRSVAQGSLLNGVSTRCFECYKISREHGPTSKKNRHPLYNMWMSMIARCENPKNIGYKRYGGRGIKVCQRWKHLPNFAEDMGPRPPNFSIERINNDGNYEPSNCKWASKKEQANNTRRNRIIEHSGIKKNVTQWAEFFGIKPVNLSKFLGRHTFEDAYTYYSTEDL